MAKKSYLQELLGKNETILLITRQHWFVLFSSIALEILLIVILIGGISLVVAMTGFVAAAIGLVLVLVPVVGMLRDIIIWYNREYVVTNRRVIQISGVFRKDVVDSSLEKVNDVKMSQSFLGRLFDYGDVEILTASEIGVNLFKRIGDPVKFKTAMINAKEQLGFENDAVMSERHTTRDIPGLIAELDELRKKGILSEAEFQKKKSELLQKM